MCAVAQEARDDRERLLEAIDAVVEGKAEGAVLRLVPARAETEDQPAAADLVDGVGHLGQQGRVAETGADDQGAELDPPGGGRQRREERPALPGPLRRSPGGALR